MESQYLGRVGRVRSLLYIAPLFLAAIVASNGCGSQAASVQNTTTPVATAASTPAETKARQVEFEVAKSYPHDRAAFTQGLLWHDGALYESTGLERQSSLRRVDLSTGRVLQSYRLPNNIFAEGLALANDKLIQISWQNEQAFVYDLKTFNPLGQWQYSGEGWGLAFDGKSFIMSDGSEYLSWRDAQTFREQKRIAVTMNGKAVRALNELEWINGEVWANVWHADYIVRINPQTGVVNSYLDCSMLRNLKWQRGGEDVLNGIAYDAQSKRIFITGKRWPRIFEIRLKNDQ